MWNSGALLPSCGTWGFFSDGSQGWEANVFTHYVMPASLGLCRLGYLASFSSICLHFAFGVLTKPHLKKKTKQTDKPCPSFLIYEKV